MAVGRPGLQRARQRSLCMTCQCLHQPLSCTSVGWWAARPAVAYAIAAVHDKLFCAQASHNCKHGCWPCWQAWQAYTCASCALQATTPLIDQQAADGVCARRPQVTGRCTCTAHARLQASAIVAGCQAEPPACGPGSTTKACRMPACSASTLRPTCMAASVAISCLCNGRQLGRHVRRICSARCSCSACLPVFRQ
jgi:hypothetical protein